MNISRLSGAIKALRAKIPEEVNRATKEVAMVVLETAASATPVDTTQALSNWQIGVGARPITFIGPHVPGFAGVTKYASLSVVESEGNKALQNRQVGVDIHIVNNADYIEGLNDGTISRQPGQFVEKALLAGRLQIQRTKLRLP